MTIAAGTGAPVQRASRGALGFFVLAFVLRALFLVASSDAAWPHSMHYEGDAPTWARWASALARGEPFEFDLPLRAPGVAYVLALVHGASFESVKLVWCALSAATVALTFLFLARTIGGRVAAFAATWLSCSYGDLQLATSLNNETPYALCLVASLAASLRFVERPTFALAAALGLVHAAATLLRAEHLLFAVSSVVWIVWRASRATVAQHEPGTSDARGADRGAPRALVARLAVGVLAFFAVCAPWSVRAHLATADFNHHAAPIAWDSLVPPWSADARAAIDGLPAFAREPNARYLTDLRRAAGDPRIERDDVERFFAEWGATPEPLAGWTLVTWKGPLDFALANHPDADGGFSRAALADGRDRGGEPEFSFARPSHLRLLNHGYALGVGWLAEDPARTARLLGAKLARFGDGATLGFGARDFPYGASGVRRPVDLTVPSAALAAKLGFAALFGLGLVVAWRRKLGGLVLLVLVYKLVVTLAFYGYARQAASIGFVFACLGAFAFDELARHVGPERRVNRLAAAVLAAAAACALVVGVVEWRAPTQFAVRSTAATPRIVSPSEWGSVESFDELVLEAR
ncbi:MAG: glycosyltransferase family 39 protein [Planctomycetes bacterium]|nr:glycosyltransferase family 39 protein [Planctomycetota bacterium]